MQEIAVICGNIQRLREVRLVGIDLSDSGLQKAHTKREFGPATRTRREPPRPTGRPPEKTPEPRNTIVHAVFRTRQPRTATANRSSFACMRPASTQTFATTTSTPNIITTNIRANTSPKQKTNTPGPTSFFFDVVNRRTALNPAAEHGHPDAAKPPTTTPPARTAKQARARQPGRPPRSDEAAARGRCRQRPDGQWRLLLDFCFLFLFSLSSPSISAEILQVVLAGENL